MCMCLGSMQHGTDAQFGCRRCGPFEPALAALQDPRVKALVNGMVTAAFPLAKGVEAIDAAQRKGALKVQLVMD